jgi:shikimate dehydrogenase
MMRKYDVYSDRMACEMGAALKINGKTKITGIIGWPIEHTLSPAMHNAAYESLSLDYCYVPFPVSPDALKDAINAIKALNIRGINVTVPHKENVMAYLDEIDTEAACIGAVNTLVNAEGKLIGYNTDGKGFMQSLAENAINTEDKDILIIGAGGAAHAVGYSLVKKAKSLSLFGRTKERVEKLVHDLNTIKNSVLSCNDLSAVGRYHMIINATPLGLRKEDPLPFDTSSLKPGQIVYDLIYKKTRLLEQASKKGCVTVSGLGMLLWQGVFTFELWTGRMPDVDVMRNALLQAMKDE